MTVSLTGEHEREFITYQEEPQPLEWSPDSPTVGATHIGMSAELPDWVRRLRAAGTVVYGGVGWDSSGNWPASVLHRLDQIDVFVPNDVEAMHYTRTGSATAAARELSRYVELAVVTCGSRGVVACERSSGCLTELPAVRVTALDPTGAGDVFVASLMATGSFDWPLEQRLRLAGLAASLSVRSLGGAVSAPRPVDLARFLTAEEPPGDWSAIRSWAASSYTQERRSGGE